MSLTVERNIFYKLVVIISHHDKEKDAQGICSHQFSRFSHKKKFGGHKSSIFSTSEKKLILHRFECRFNVSGSGSSGSSGVRERSKDKPPKLPPRDNSIYGPHNIPKVGPLIIAKLFSGFKNTKVAQTC